MTSLRMRPVVYCDKCSLALIYTSSPSGLILYHEKDLLYLRKSECERAGQSFKAPVIELEPVAHNEGEPQ